MKYFATMNVSEQKLIAKQPRPVPKLKLKTKDSFTTNGRQSSSKNSPITFVLGKESEILGPALLVKFRH